jgi:polyhydroxyalkanoate synthase
LQREYGVKAEQKPGPADQQTRPAETRPGPRPLPLHLSIAGMTWLGSQSALPLLRNGWPGWNPAAAVCRLAAETTDRSRKSQGR